MKKAILLLALSGILAIPVSGQLKEVGTFMAGGAADAEKLLEAYLEPFGNALGANLSAGWYSSAKAHNLLGFDITATTSVAFIPDASKSFDLNSLAFSALPTNVSRSFSSATAPTMAGEKGAGPTISYNYNDGTNSATLASYKTPQGLGVGFIPAPMFKLGIGLVKGTEIMGRYVPTLNLGKYGEFGLWGVGIKHELKQYIPFVKRVPFLNLSLMGGYTKMMTGANIALTPEDMGMTTSTLPATTWDNQKMELGASNWTVNLLVSADIPVVTFYGGVGISSSKTDLRLNGNYPLASFNTGTQNVDVTAVKDPIDISIGGKDGTITKPRLNIGMKFKLAVIHINFDYTYANYSIATAGLGISFR
jgi:hypothetical protein